MLPYKHYITLGNRLKDLSKSHAYARLDVVRGLAAIVVLIAHIGQVLFWRVIGSDSHIAMLLGIFARHAVLIFFVLSGNLITRSMLLNIRRNNYFSATEYVASRIARIYPPLIGAILVALIVWIIVHGLHLPGSVSYGLPGDLYRVRASYTIHLKDIFGAITMRDGMLEANGPLWTLFIEVQTYMLVMAIAAWTTPSWFTKAWTFLLALIALALLKDHLFFVAIWFLGAASAFFNIKKTLVAGRP